MSEFFLKVLNGAYSVTSEWMDLLPIQAQQAIIDTAGQLRSQHGECWLRKGGRVNFC